ncbi:uncharacterized protein DNG_03457 [Cephalotrichum gorgonifer]|uniref:Uncharacterized protein n=1 Tax=Cephalotrichum gorgonifer TaxID=2041049 RepID=A0AAE8MUA2_9PEZI|nr:uncharacterized protein DNG_03457 [Cephalotrichum gorgonifer]
MSLDTVGTLLAAIANLLHEGLWLLARADKSFWGPDEHEQVRALEEALDDAKKDFQELPPHVNGQVYYENDRKPESIAELESLHARFNLHIQNLRNWAAAGGAVNPVWAAETAHLRRLLHRAQCRAAARIFALGRESEPRCLGAFLVYRKQRAWAGGGGGGPDAATGGGGGEYGRRQLEELVACNAVGKFERFGDQDVAFVCDFCDGYLVWEDLESMPSLRSVDDRALARADPASPGGQQQQEPPAPPPAGEGVEHWQATGFALSTREEKSVVFAPLAIGNHVAPAPGQWRARVACPFCEDRYVLAQGDDEMEQIRYGHDENTFEDLAAFQGHLEWQHTALPRPALLPSARESCTVM